MSNTDCSQSTKNAATEADELLLHAGFWRRMAAIFYDSLLILALFFLATAVVLPLNDGKAFSSDQYAYPVFLFLVCFVFFGWFWTKGGQTPGMKAWKLTLISDDYPNESNVSWKQAVRRYIAALFSWLVFGIGFAVIAVNKQKLSWHDRLSNTRMIYRR